MNAKQFKAINSRPGNFGYAECAAADAWLKAYALKKLRKAIGDIDATVAEFTLAMADSHFGSLEVDDMLVKLGCYPKWLNY